MNIETNAEIHTPNLALFLWQKGDRDWARRRNCCLFLCKSLFLTCCHNHAFCSLKGKSNKVYKKGTYLLNGGHSKREVESTWRKIVGAVSIKKEDDSSFCLFTCWIGLKSAWGGIFLLLEQCKGELQSQPTCLSLAWKLPCMWALFTCPGSSPSWSLLIGNIELLVWQPTLYHEHVR